MGNVTQRTTLALLLLATFVTAGCEDSIGTGMGMLPGETAGPAVVELRSSASFYRVGEVVRLDVSIENGSNVGSVPFHLHFDPSVLQFQPPGTEGPFLGADGARTVFLAGESGPGGEIVVGISRFGAPVGARGAGSLATFEFLAVGPGPVEFRFSVASVRDPLAKLLPAAFGAVSVDVNP